MLDDDFSEYFKAKKEGADARSVYDLAEANGLNWIVRVRMLRQVFGLTMREAKEVMILDSSRSLEEHEEKLLPALEEASKLGVFDDVVTDKDIKDHDSIVDGSTPPSDTDERKGK